MKCFLLEKNNACACEFMRNTYIFIPQTKTYIKMCGFLYEDQCGIIDATVENDSNYSEDKNSDKDNFKNELFFLDYFN